ncbi:PTS transporter subunit IIABC [Mesomycoplasma neurolyticum]|uniref:Pts system enzyme IIA component n=1 Tax=Mesomycoplasma neurolyticum TaxID=2120 RepID=A0A449A4U2_9BACT|nr:glucose PTS transporter subunit IIA [Mesomycoplasma neurolyticum]VEU59257.1 pts system enzyme IIA component [Mesomycoplasma neurolyticum]
MISLRKQNNSVKVNNKNRSGKWKLVFSKISGAFLLPISIMAIAGLLLGVGSTIASNTNSDAGKIFGSFIQALGKPVFDALPLLFAAAFVVAFTNEAGVGVFAAIVGYFTFLAVQAPFFTDVYQYKFYDATNDAETIDKILADPKLGMLEHNKDLGVYYILDDKGDKILEFLGYEILGISYKAGRSLEASKQIISNSLGFKSLQTSVFGSIIVGIIVSYLYNRFHKIQLPTYISFFGGKRFVSIITIFAMIPLSFAFLLFWPWVGTVLDLFGRFLQTVPYGFESLIFGFIERSLIPFGLHHAFYAPLWYTSVGGDVASSLNDYHLNLINDVKTTMKFTTDAEAIAYIKNSVGAYAISGDSLEIAKKNIDLKNLNLKNGGLSYIDLLDYVSKNRDSFQGDSKISAASLGIDANDISFIDVVTKDGQKTFVQKSLPLFTFYEQKLSLKVGRFMQGKYPFMQFGLPAAAFAMIMAAPKQNRKFASGVVLPCAFTALVTGVTEPIEFTFLFLSPVLFWGFHAFFCALAFMLMNLFGAHIGQVFSGGFLDLIIYGALPVLKGTKFWWWAIIGVFYVPIYYFIFYFWIKKFNLATPGRGQTTRLFTKADYNSRNESSSYEGLLPWREREIVLGFGGWDNITAFNSCASRLRYDIIDKNKVDINRIKAAGATGVMFVGDNHAQAIFGPKAEQINATIISHMNADLGLIENNEADKIKVVFAKDYCKHFKKKDQTEEILDFDNEIPDVQDLDDIPNPEEEITSNDQELFTEEHEYENEVLEANDMVDFSDLTFDDEEEVEEEVEEISEDGTLKVVVKKHRRYYSKIKNPTYGIVKKLEILNDGVFSEKMVGDGVAIYVPRNVKRAKIYAPFDSVVTTAFPTGHAYGFTSKNGVNVLIHVGIDTVNLNGEGFTSHVQQGQKVKTGDLVAEVDMQIIREKATNAEIVYVVPQDSRKTEVYDVHYGRLKAGKVAFKVK